MYAQIAVLGAAFVATSPSGVSAKLGWSIDESLDTHQWKEGDWWRPAEVKEVKDPEPIGSLSPADSESIVLGEQEIAVNAVTTKAASGTGGGDERRSDDWKIVAFSSHNYLGITERWYDRLTDLGYTEHVVAAMDEQLFDALAAKGYRVEDHVVSPTEKLEPGEPVPGWGRHLWKLWRYRLSYALRQTQLGRSIFLVDVDTMWNRYVALHTLFNGSQMDNNTDVFLSQGTVYPPDVYDKWGFVGCMGSVAFRATSAAQTLLRQAIRTCAEGSSCDDQVAVDRALMRRYRIEWDRDTGVGVGVLRGGGGDDANASKLGEADSSVLEQQHLTDEQSHVNTVVALRDGDKTGHGAGDASNSTGAIKIFEPSVTVRMWPKPFVFRSFMKDVRRVNVDEAAQLAKAPNVPSGAGTCLGQVSERKENLIGVTGDTAGELGDSDTGQSVSLIGGGIDFSNPFIVAPCLAKDGKEKIEAWDKFQRFCFIIETKAYLEQRLPEAGKEPAEGAKAITDT